ncbi:MAG: hypothetical protein [Cressdnaviricota sp.]|nr:MAG: hypothetical protein [Cressdnaviricota sp.]
MKTVEIRIGSHNSRQSIGVQHLVEHRRSPSDFLTVIKHDKTNRLSRNSGSKPHRNTARHLNRFCNKLQTCALVVGSSLRNKSEWNNDATRRNIGRNMKSRGIRLFRLDGSSHAINLTECDNTCITTFCKLTTFGKALTRGHF